VSQGKPDVPVSKISGWSGIANLRRRVIALWKEISADHICSARDALVQSVCSTNEALVATRWTTDQQIVLETSVEKERMLENLSLSTSM